MAGGYRLSAAVKAAAAVNLGQHAGRSASVLTATPHCIPCSVPHTQWRYRRRAAPALPAPALAGSEGGAAAGSGDGCETALLNLSIGTYALAACPDSGYLDLMLPTTRTQFCCSSPR